jgi:hypothetical protein
MMPICSAICHTFLGQFSNHVLEAGYCVSWFDIKFEEALLFLCPAYFEAVTMLANASKDWFCFLLL